MNTPSKGGMRRFFWIVLILALVFALVRIYFRATDDFRISNITYDLPYHSEWEIPVLTPDEKAQLKTILSQNFSYLGKGAQSYAFASEDQKYVLKFFKFKHLKPSWYVDILPDIPPFSEYKKKLAARKERKLIGAFSGYKIAYDIDRPESGLIYIQLNPSHEYLPVTLIDKIGLKRNVDLGSVVFILQEKGVTLRVALAQLLDEGNIALAKQRIGQIFNLYLSEYRKGIYDHDHGVLQNSGFIGDRVIHLDVGKIHKDEKISQPQFYHEDLILVANKIKTWLCKNYPVQCPEMIKDMEEKLTHIFGSPFTFNSYETNPE